MSSTPTSPTFTAGQRVATTVDALAAWAGAFSAPAGTLGIITDGPSQFGTYGVLLDGDPDGLPAAFNAAELVAAEDTRRPSRARAAIVQALTAHGITTDVEPLAAGILAALAGLGVPAAPPRHLTVDNLTSDQLDQLQDEAAEARLCYSLARAMHEETEADLRARDALVEQLRAGQTPTPAVLAPAPADGEGDPFPQGFRLHPGHGAPLDGVLFPGGRCLVVDSAEDGLISAALSLDDLVRGYPGAHIEWQLSATTQEGPDA